jgi:hypothetical protein
MIAMVPFLAIAFLAAAAVLGLVVAVGIVLAMRATRQG